MAQKGPLDPYSNDLTGEPILVNPSNVPTDFAGGSLRRFTQKQFASKTAIVGSTIDRALRDLVGRYQSLLPQDLEKRWVHVMRTGGFSPASIGYQSSLPYLPVWNGGTGNVFASGTPDNLYRFKGTQLPDVDNAAHPDAQYIWTQQFYFRKPARLIGVNWSSISCGGEVAGYSHVYQDSFRYGNPPPTGKAVNQWVNDLYIDVSITNRFYPQDMTKAETLIQRVKINAKDVLFSQLQPSNQYSTIEPLYPTASGVYAPYGFYIDVRNINVPIPEFSVLRLGIIAPTSYTFEGGVAGWTLSGHVTSWAVTTAEALR